MLPTSLLDSQWHSLIEQQGEASFYHSQEWLDLLTHLYGYTSILLTAANASEQLTGLLPLCFMQSPLTGRRLVSLPFSDSCPLLASDDASADDLLQQAIRLAQQKKVRYLELRTGSNAVLARCADLIEANLYVRWQLPLTADPQSIWSGLRKPVQRQIKKAQTLGVKVYMAEHREEMTRFYQLHLHTRMKHGMPAQPQRFFYELWDTFSQNGTIQLLLAEYQGAIIASMLLIASGTTVRYAYGASETYHLHLAPNNLLLWTAITWGCTHGYQTLDLGRTARDNQGLMEYKRRWGAIEEPLPYYYYPRSAGWAATSESSWKFRLFTTCWKHLPLSIAGPVGGQLYKHLG